MDAFQTLLIWVHFISLGLGATASFGIPTIAFAMPKTAPEARPALAALAGRLSIYGRSGLALLILTGIIMVLTGPGVGAVSGWFWVKMALVVVLTGGVVMGLRLAKRAQAGDMGAAALARKVGLGNLTVLILILLSAVLAFG